MSQPRPVRILHGDHEHVWWYRDDLEDAEQDFQDFLAECDRLDLLFTQRTY